MRHKRTFVATAFSIAAVCAAGPSQAQIVASPYSGSYTATSLGSIEGVPSNYGGLTFLDASTIVIGGAANGSGGHIYSVLVNRGAGNHITGFGAVSLFGGPGSTIGEYNDGGVSFGPGNVLFLARWPVNQIGQVKSGATDESRVDTGPSNASSSVSALNFVPSGFGGAGGMKVVTYGAGQWYDAITTPDGSGTYNLLYSQVDLDPTTLSVDNVPGSPEGFVYIPAGNPQFTANSMLLAAYGNGTIDSYQVDALGNPVLSTRKTFISNLTGAEGAAIDPVTGDFLFSTFGGGSQIVLVTGFLAPVPEPQTYAMFIAGLALLGFVAKRRALRTAV